jgi:preprotein translocase subunit SecE
MLTAIPVDEDATDRRAEPNFANSLSSLSSEISLLRLPSVVKLRTSTSFVAPLCVVFALFLIFVDYQLARHPFRRSRAYLDFAHGFVLRV